jgi:hypothetical protein
MKAEMKPAKRMSAPVRECARDAQRDSRRQMEEAAPRSGKLCDARA